LDNLALAFGRLGSAHAGGVNGDLAGVHRGNQFCRTLVDDFLGLLVGLVVAEPSFFPRELTGLDAGLDFRNIFRKFDLRPMTLPGTGRNLGQIFPNFGGGKVALLQVRRNFVAIAAEFDVSALSLAVAQFDLQRLADRHPFGRREVLPDLVLGILPGRDTADVHHAGRNGLSPKHLLEGLQPAFTEDQDALLRDADGLEEPFGGEAKNSLVAGPDDIEICGDLGRTRNCRLVTSRVQ
jgi:hypothetical protein